MTDIARNLALLRPRMTGVRLIAVSKKQDPEAIGQALDAGQRLFGENRVQEAQRKFTSLRTAYPDLELHLIGPLQTNKALLAVQLFDVIQTLDRPSLADALALAIQQSGRTPRLYIEVNIGNEPQKAGIAPAELENFLNYCQEKKLTITGLMCIPPHNQDPRPSFMRMKELAERLALPHLSMGMSGDFESAIECGATEVRLGTAIFGQRKT